MSLIFYYSPQSSASPVHWTLEELGVPYEKVLVDLKAERPAAFLKINPNGKVPALVHDGVAIFESAAIQIYLGETFGVDKGLFPAPSPHRGEALKWIIWTNVTMGDAVGRLWRNGTEMLPVEQRSPAQAAAAKEELQGCLRILNDALQDKQYLLGDQFTVADIHLSAWIEYLGMMGVDASAHTAVAAWVARCVARPAHDRAP